MKAVNPLLFLVASALSAVACDDLQTVDTLECPEGNGPFTIETSRVTGAVAFDPPAAPLTRGDLLILDGAAHHEDGLAIRDVRVGSVSAEKLAFNFSAWRLQLSWEQIIGLGPIDADGKVAIPVQALDACGRLYPFAEVSVAVDPEPNVRIDGLTLSVAYPEGTETLPANGRTQALVTVDATGRPGGAGVVVKATGGTFQGYGAMAEVQLAAPFGDASTGRVQLLLVATEPGAVLLTAEAKGVLASATARAVGGPTLAPAEAVLLPGTSISLRAEAAAGLVSCVARATAGGSAELGGEPLDLAPVDLDASLLENDGSAKILVTVAEDAASESSISITCEDVHGQSGGARLSTEGAL